MKKKHKFLKLAIMTFMVLSAAFATSDTLAYWVEVTGNSDIADANVATGEWDQAFPYDPNICYDAGDLVTNVGQTFNAKRSGCNLREPGVDKGYNKDWNDGVN